MLLTKTETFEPFKHFLETNNISFKLFTAYMLYAVYCKNLPILTQHKTSTGQYIKTVDTELIALGQ